MGGIYEFDIAIYPSYPSEPPIVTFTITLSSNSATFIVYLTFKHSEFNEKNKVFSRHLDRAMKFEFVIR